MRKILTRYDYHIPEGVQVTCNCRKVVVKGPRGELSRDLSHLPIDIRKKGKSIVEIELWFGNRKSIASIRTVAALIRNMVIGVTKGYLYKMRLVSAHFPMNVSVTDSGDQVEIRNFLGERRIRRIDTLSGVKISKSDDVKDQLELRGNDVNNVSLTAALIQQACHVKNKDIRKFLDGIYVSEKSNITMD